MEAVPMRRWASDGNQGCVVLLIAAPIGIAMDLLSAPGWATSLWWIGAFIAHAWWGDPVRQALWRQRDDD